MPSDSQNRQDTTGLEYRELFVGGGSIGLKLLSDNTGITKIWINDKDIGIACLWTAVIRYHDEFKERVRSFKPSVEAFYELRDELTTVSAMPVEPARIVDLGFKKLAVHQTRIPVSGPSRAVRWVVPSRSRSTR